jgi:hypothetical protein
MKTLTVLILALFLSTALAWSLSGRRALDGGRLRVAGALAAPGAALLAWAVGLGLWARRGPGHSSPTVAWFARRGAMAAAAAAAFWVLAAPAWPAWILYLCVLSAAAGASLWFAHLPPRL